MSNRRKKMDIPATSSGIQTLATEVQKAQLKEQQAQHMTAKAALEAQRDSIRNQKATRTFQMVSSWVAVIAVIISAFSVAGSAASNKEAADRWSTDQRSMVEGRALAVTITWDETATLDMGDDTPGKRYDVNVYNPADRPIRNVRIFTPSPIVGPIERHTTFVGPGGARSIELGTLAPGESLKRDIKVKAMHENLATGGFSLEFTDVEGKHWYSEEGAVPRMLEDNEQPTL